MPRQQILEEWNREHKDRAAASLQSNFYEARQRLKKKVVPLKETVVKQDITEPAPGISPVQTITATYPPAAISTSSDGSH